MRYKKFWEKVGVTTLTYSNAKIMNRAANILNPANTVRDTLWDWFSSFVVGMNFIINIWFCLLNMIIIGILMSTVNCMNRPEIFVLCNRNCSNSSYTISNKRWNEDVVPSLLRNRRKNNCFCRTYKSRKRCISTWKGVTKSMWRTTCLNGMKITSIIKEQIRNREYSILYDIEARTVSVRVADCWDCQIWIDYGQIVWITKKRLL